MSKLIGKPPINPFLWVTGKFVGYIVWVALLLHLAGVNIGGFTISAFFSYLGFTFLGIGVLLFAVSMVNLGNSVSFGVPEEETVLKVKGIYRYSRNPMYVGFDLLTLSSILITSNFIVLVLGVYSIVIYHYIILGEEAFLKKRFGRGFQEYCSRTRRYF